MNMEKCCITITRPMKTGKKRTPKADKTNTLKDAQQKLIDFLTGSKKHLYLQFPDGFFLKVTKHTIKGVSTLEVHTEGYDGDFLLMEGIDWIAWHLYDTQANKIIL